MENTVNEVHNEIKKILMDETGNINNPEATRRIKLNIDSYLMSVSEIMGYMNLPVVKAEVEGPFMTLNFLDEKGDRLETFGDLIYYMDTGINNGANNGL